MPWPMRTTAITKRRRELRKNWARMTRATGWTSVNSVPIKKRMPMAATMRRVFRFIRGGRRKPSERVARPRTQRNGMGISETPSCHHVDGKL